MSNQVDLYSEKYTIDTPEQVSFGYQVAGIGNRFIAALMDSALLLVLLVGLNIIVVVVLALVNPEQTVTAIGDETDRLSWAGGFVLALYSIVNFLLIWGYYVLFEWLWNGQTPGKRMARIRVVEMDGSPCDLVTIVIRNLVRVVDFLPMGYGVGLVSMFVDLYARRLGDLAAGTLVVKGHREVQLADLLAVAPVATPDTPVELPATDTLPPSLVEDASASKPAPALEQRFAGLRRLSTADHDLIMELLDRRARGLAQEQLVDRMARVIAHKMGLEPPASGQSSRAFLYDVVEACRHFIERSSS